MIAKDNRAIATAFLHALAAQDVTQVQSMLADDLVWWIPTDQPGGMQVGKDQIVPMLGAFFSVMATAPSLEIGRITAEDDRVCIEQTLRGGMTKGGAPYGNDYHFLLRIAGGKIAEVREFMNPILAAPIAAEVGMGA